MALLLNAAESILIDTPHWTSQGGKGGREREGERGRGRGREGERNRQRKGRREGRREGGRRGGMETQNFKIKGTENVLDMCQEVAPGCLMHSIVLAIVT